MRLNKITKWTCLISLKPDLLFKLQHAVLWPQVFSFQTIGDFPKVNEMKFSWLQNISNVLVLHKVPTAGAMRRPTTGRYCNLGGERRDGTWWRDAATKGIASGCSVRVCFACSDNSTYSRGSDSGILRWVLWHLYLVVSMWQWFLVA